MKGQSELRILFAKSGNTGRKGQLLKIEKLVQHRGRCKIFTE